MMLKLEKLDWKWYKQENFITSAKVVKFHDNNWFVDIGLKSLVKLDKWFIEDYCPNIALGYKLKVYVSRYCDNNRLSRIDQSKFLHYFYLDKLRKIFLNNGLILGKIIRVKFGGCIVEILNHKVGDKFHSFKCFLPNTKSIVNYHEIIDQEFYFKIVKCDLKNNSVVLKFKSIKDIFEKLLYDFKEGDHITGKIWQLKDFGAIVKVNNIFCFLNFNDLVYDSKKKVDLKVGQIISNLLIVKKDFEGGRIFLSAKHIFDPIENYLTIGNVYKVTIQGLSKHRNYKVIINDFPFIHGHLNLQELEWAHINNISILENGTNLNVQFLKIVGSLPNFSYRALNKEIPLQFEEELDNHFILKLKKQQSNIWESELFKKYIFINASSYFKIPLKENQISAVVFFYKHNLGKVFFLPSKIAWIEQWFFLKFKIKEGVLNSKCLKILDNDTLILEVENRRIPVHIDTWKGKLLKNNEFFKFKILAVKNKKIVVHNL